jgi:hypothetical protein
MKLVRGCLSAARDGDEPGAAAWRAQPRRDEVLLAAVPVTARAYHTMGLGEGLAGCWWSMCAEVGGGPLAPWLSAELLSMVPRASLADFTERHLARFGRDGALSLAEYLSRCGVDRARGALDGARALGGDLGLSLLRHVQLTGGPATAAAAARALARCGERGAAILHEGLSDPTPAARRRAARALEGAAPLPLEALKAALLRERAPTVRAALGRLIFARLERSEPPIELLVPTAAAHATLDARLCAQPATRLARWLDLAALPAPRWTSGAQLSPGALRWVVSRLALEAPGRRCPALAAVLDHTGRDGLAALLDALTLLHDRSGPASAAAWVCFARAPLGTRRHLERSGEELFAALRGSRPSLAARHMAVLAFAREPYGVPWLDRVASGQRWLHGREQARALLEARAREEGLSADELVERCLPSLGFDAAGRQRFAFGRRAFTLALEGDSVALLDAAGRRRSGTPRALKGEDKALIKICQAALKALRAEVAAHCEAQLRRLDRALATGRSWPLGAWRALTAHPLMRTYAEGLVWERLRPAAPPRRFMLDEHRLGQGLDYDPVELLPGDAVRLAHPADLSPAERRGWWEYLGDNERLQPLDQIARPLAVPLSRSALRGRLRELGEAMARAGEARIWSLEEGLTRRDYTRLSADDEEQREVRRSLGEGWEVRVRYRGEPDADAWSPGYARAVFTDLDFRCGGAPADPLSVPLRVWSEVERDLRSLVA